MLVIAGTLVIDPANRERAISGAAEMMEETHKEEGCESYTFSTDLADPGTFYIFERWASQEALDAHFVTPHMAKFGGLMGELGIKSMDVQKYEIASVGPVR